MTNKKAIRVLEHIEYYLKIHTNESCEEEHTAISLAIKALEEKTQGDLISREALKKTLCEEYEAREHYIGEIMLKAIDNAPSVCGNNPKWCENCVSKGKCASTREQGGTEK